MCPQAAQVLPTTLWCRPCPNPTRTLLSPGVKSPPLPPQRPLPGCCCGASAAGAVLCQRSGVIAGTWIPAPHPPSQGHGEGGNTAPRCGQGLGCSRGAAAGTEVLWWQLLCRALSYGQTLHSCSKGGEGTRCPPGTGSAGGGRWLRLAVGPGGSCLGPAGASGSVLPQGEAAVAEPRPLRDPAFVETRGGPGAAPQVLGSCATLLLPGDLGVASPPGLPPAASLRPCPALVPGLRSSLAALLGSWRGKHSAAVPSTKPHCSEQIRLELGCIFVK